MLPDTTHLASSLEKYYWCTKYSHRWSIWLHKSRNCVCLCSSSYSRVVKMCQLVFSAWEMPWNTVARLSSFISHNVPSNSCLFCSRFTMSFWSAPPSLSFFLFFFPQKSRVEALVKREVGGRPHTAPPKQGESWRSTLPVSCRCPAAVEELLSTVRPVTPAKATSHQPSSHHRRGFWERAIPTSV